ncbi:MAG: RNA polymerase subunit sigma-24 [Armatimonadetes bacterium]|nr:MAG: RNA polymerase subunit sigma-24 [Armatimonadota bacterium]
MTTYAPRQETTTNPDVAGLGTDDQRLANAIIEGDKRALHDAYALHASYVHGVALGILKDPHLASDVTQEVFVRLWQRGERFDANRGSLRSYLQIDGHGRAIDLLRSRRSSASRERLDYQKMSSTHTAGTEELALTSITSDRVRDAMLNLPNDQRTPIAMAFFDGNSYRDVANVLGLPEGTIKSRIRLGMKRLQLTLGTEVL